MGVVGTHEGAHRCLMALLAERHALAGEESFVVFRAQAERVHGDDPVPRAVVHRAPPSGAREPGSRRTRWCLRGIRDRDGDAVAGRDLDQRAP